LTLKRSRRENEDKEYSFSKILNMSRSSSTSGEKPVDAENLNSDEAPLSDKADKAEKINYPSPRNRIVIMSAVYLASFLVTLVRGTFVACKSRLTLE